MRRVLCTVLAVAALAFYGGPAGAEQVTVAEADLPAPALGFDDGEPCTAVPDSVPGIFDFTAACTVHDACYASGQQTQAACDIEFLQNMNAACLAHHPSALDPARYACRTFAQLYYLGVTLFGSFYF